LSVVGSTPTTFLRAEASSTTTTTAGDEYYDEKKKDEAVPPLPLRDCVCLVTGASRGIGKGVAVELGKAGAVVYVTGTSSTEKQEQRQKQQNRSSFFFLGKNGKKKDLSGLRSSSSATNDEDVGGPGTIEETARLVTEAGGTGIAAYCDHAVDSDVYDLVRRIERQHGRLDILVNNAFRLPAGGVEKLYGKFWEQGPDVWDAVHAVGLRSHYVATCAAMPLMLKSIRDDDNSNEEKKNRRRRQLPRPFVAMIGSFGGLTYTFNVPYGVGKAGVDRLAKDMAVELTPEGVCVVSFWPGVVKTERTVIAVENGNWDRYVGIPLDNAESPEYTGKAICGVALDPDNMSKTGTYQVVAELAREYGFSEEDGSQPPSIRSLRFLLPAYAFDSETRNKIPSWLIPDWKLPFWVMARGRPPDPDAA